MLRHILTPISCALFLCILSSSCERGQPTSQRRADADAVANTEVHHAKDEVAANTDTRPMTPLRPAQTGNVIATDEASFSPWHPGGSTGSFLGGIPRLSSGGSGGGLRSELFYCGDGKASPGECAGWLDSAKNPASVSFHFIDLRNEKDAVKVTDGDDDSAFADLVPAFKSTFLQETISKIIVSTNGILDTGEDLDDATDYDVVCPLPDEELSGDRFYVLYNDLEAQKGVFYKYFAQCPRPADIGNQAGCHVFHWAPAEHYDYEYNKRSFDIEAVLYDDGHFVYQYADLSPENGGNIERGASSVTGVQNKDGTSFFSYGCNEQNKLPDTGNLAVRLAFCPLDCVANTCGDGKKGENEDCDDGNTTSGDGCSSDCLRECGDNFVDEDGSDGYREDCDDGEETENCDSDCTFAECGDGYYNEETDEDCDDGNQISGDGCTAECEFECGDGITDTDPSDGYSEGCDTFGEETRLCNESCSLSVCGDDITNETAGEECDDGNTISGDGCSRCFDDCGDGRLDQDPSDGYYEQCDTDEDTAICNDDCTLSVCGDDHQNEAAGEQCDDGGESEGCDADCTFAFCGDGYVNTAAGEECEPPNAGQCDQNCRFFLPD